MRIASLYPDDLPSQQDIMLLQIDPSNQWEIQISITTFELNQMLMATHSFIESIADHSTSNNFMAHLNTYWIPDDSRDVVTSSLNLTSWKIDLLTRSPIKERMVCIVVISEPGVMKNIVLEAVFESLVLNVKEILFNDISLKSIITTFRTEPTSFRNNRERRVETSHVDLIAARDTLFLSI